jgi:hypothetical protein
MNALKSRIAYHPTVVESTLYLTDVLARADYSVPGTIMVIVGSSAFHLFKRLRQSKRTCVTVSTF